MIAIAPLAYLHLLYDEWKDNGVFWAAVLVHHRKKRLLFVELLSEK